MFGAGCKLDKGLVRGCDPKLSIKEYMECLKTEPPRNSSPPTMSKQEEVLKNQGYKNIQIGDPALFGCDEKDSLLNSNTFTADTPIGTHVSGYVCCGWLKGCTVRYK